MRCGLFRCPERWVDWFPPGMLRPDGREAEEIVWDLLVLTPEGCAYLNGRCPRCRVLLLPGDCRIVGTAETVVTYGLSNRDSLTLSSLTEPVLCIQRRLRRPDGSVIEPQELPLPPLPEPADRLLPLLGAWLLQMPLTGTSLL